VCCLIGSRAATIHAAPAAASDARKTIESTAKPRTPTTLSSLGGAGQDRAKALAALWAQTWIAAARKRLHHNVLAIALANKLARIAWAVLHKGRAFECVKTKALAFRPA
jgi:hypothetical protein